MKLDFSQQLTDLDGNPLQDGPPNARRDATLGYLAATALLAADPQKPESAEDKVRAYDVAVRVYKGGEQEVSAEDISLIKRKVGEQMTPIVVGQMYRILEQQA